MTRGRSASGLRPREIAADILLRVETLGAFADAALGIAFRREASSAREALSAMDRALATRLVYGALAWQRRLDWILDRWCRPKSSKLDPAVRIALRLGVFQLFFSDRIPAFAAVDTSVEVAKRSGRRSGATLVNAVLRRAVREGAPEPPNGDSPEALGVRFSHPDWLVARWIEELGLSETRELLAANNDPQPLVLRAHDPGRTLAELRTLGIEVRPGDFSPLALVVRGPLPERFFDSPKGFVPQGEASQLVPFLLDVRPGDRVLDACAAPGGKAGEIAEWLAQAGVVVAADVSMPGVRQIAFGGRGVGQRTTLPVNADASRPPFRAQAFDRVLVDSPCSGVGTLRSHPEIRWRLSRDDVCDLSERQRRILAAVAPLVRSGGSLVYATCSLLREENDEVVESFLGSHADFFLADAGPTLPEPARVHGVTGALRTFPHRGGLDGFYAVRLLRRH